MARLNGRRPPERAGASRKAAEILEQMCQLYRHGGASYRDVLLQTGQLLHEYILAALSEAGQGDWRSRKDRGLCREKCIKEAAAYLDVKRASVYTWLATWAAVDLLGKGRDLGQTTHAALTEFKVFVERPSFNHELPPAAEVEREQWRLKPGLAQGAQKLFDRCLAER